MYVVMVTGYVMTRQVCKISIIPPARDFSFKYKKISKLIYMDVANDAVDRLTRLHKRNKEQVRMGLTC